MRHLRPERLPVESRAHPKYVASDLNDLGLISRTIGVMTFKSFNNNSDKNLSFRFT